MKKYLNGKLEDIYDSIKDTIHDIRIIPWRIKTRILIIWHWLPIIWNDYDWDFNFALKALQHKIKRSRIKMNKSTWKAVDWPKNYRRMLECEKLLDKMIEEEFAPEDRDEFHKKWPWDLQPFKKDEEGRSYWPTMVGEQKKDFDRICKKQDMLEKECIDRFFYILKKYYRRWWD